jgi:hypothetical protein
MIATLEPIVQAAVLHFADHPSALLWLETSDEGVRWLVRRGYLQALNQTVVGVGSYELADVAESWLQTEPLSLAVAALRTDPRVQAAEATLSRRQTELQRKLAHSLQLTQRTSRQEIDLALGEGLRDLAARYGPELLVIRGFHQWAVVQSIEEARKVLADLEAEIRTTRDADHRPAPPES